MYISIYMYMYLCKYIHLYIYIYIYVHIYRHCDRSTTIVLIYGDLSYLCASSAHILLPYKCFQD